VDVRQREQILSKRFLKRCTLFEIKAGLTNSTGIQLIDTIQNDMVKSAEDVGWEKQLKDIEKERLPLLRLSTI
jgi:DNA topoisomerase-3